MDTHTGGNSGGNDMLVVGIIHSKWECCSY